MFTAKPISLTSLIYFTLKHSVLPLQNNTPESRAKIRIEEWELDQDLAFGLECAVTPDHWTQPITKFSLSMIENF